MSTTVPIQVPTHTIQILGTILYYQNKYLLHKIAKCKGWDAAQLTQQFLDETLETVHIPMEEQTIHLHPVIPPPSAPRKKKLTRDLLSGHELLKCLQEVSTKAAPRRRGRPPKKKTASIPMFHPIPPPRTIIWNDSFVKDQEKPLPATLSEQNNVEEIVCDEWRYEEKVYLHDPCTNNVYAFPKGTNPPKLVGKRHHDRLIFKSKKTIRLKLHKKN